MSYHATTYTIIKQGFSQTLGKCIFQLYQTAIENQSDTYTKVKFLHFICMG